MKKYNLNIYKNMDSETLNNKNQKDRMLNSAKTYLKRILNKKTNTQNEIKTITEKLT